MKTYIPMLGLLLLVAYSLVTRSEAPIHDAVTGGMLGLSVAFNVYALATFRRKPSVA
ncbi:hypothetical protein [Paenibacillus methanolicus]|uniref:Uncharacterized protein n=1 Tax=Paenibacillus methanolicus TaxID=582686 RepID=A0A5S5BU08_9BACL|nr:hypothetical protein [Paenibacillus methanolicus]TYP70499.1 hypothetical protein BCM02_1113 [Paenibacillus methanolicus]